MARLTIPDEPTSIEFTVTAAQSEFPISFSLFSKADLKVRVGGANIQQSAFTFTGTLLEGGGYKGGVVRLNTPVSSTSVRVSRRVKPVRPSNFPSQNSVPVRSVDMEFNKIVAQQQDVMQALVDVEKGVVDPDLLAEVVDDATAGKADSNAANVAGANALAWPERILRQRTDAGALPITAAAMLDRIPRTPADFGALPVEDVAVLTQDDTAELQAMIDGAFNDLKGANPGKSGGGIVRIDRVYRINQPLYMRKWITLEGVTPGGVLLGRDENGNNLDKTGKTLASVPGTIICGPNGKIVPKDCCTVRGLRILSDAGAKHPTNGNIAAQLAEIQAFNGYDTAIEPEYGAGDVTIEECFIVGFYLGVRLNYNERFRILDNKFDCINGVLFTDIYDTPRIERNSFWPYFIAHRLAPNTPGQAELVTPYGTCIKAALMPLPGRDRSSDGAQIIGNLGYGYTCGVDAEHLNSAIIAFNGFDTDKANSNTQNTTGIRLSGNCRRTKVLCNTTDSVGRGFDVQAYGGVMFDMNTSTGVSSSHMRVGPGATVFGGSHFIQDFNAGPPGQDSPCFDVHDNLNWLAFDTVYMAGTGNSAISNLGSWQARRRVRFGRVIDYDPRPEFVRYNPDAFTSLFTADKGGANQAIASGSDVLVTFPNETWDTFDEWNSAARTFSPKESGWYFVDWSFVAIPGSTDPAYLTASLRENGDSIRRWQSLESGHTGWAASQISGLVRMTAGRSYTFTMNAELGCTLVGAHCRVVIKRQDNV